MNNTKIRMKRKWLFPINSEEVSGKIADTNKKFNT